MEIRPFSSSSFNKSVVMRNPEITKKTPTPKRPSAQSESGDREPTN
jgi:hypothetical protein